MELEPASFPEHLQPDIDVLVRSAHAGVVEPFGPALDRVSSWCEVHSDDAGIYSGDHGNSLLLVWWESAVAKWSDGEMQSALDTDLPLSDARRVAFLRSQLAKVLDGSIGDAGDYPIACEIRIASSDARQASLCFFLSGYSFGAGPEIEWRGVYRSLDVLREELRGHGALTSLEDLAALSDSALIGEWRRSHWRPD